MFKQQNKEEDLKKKKMKKHIRYKIYFLTNKNR